MFPPDTFSRLPTFSGTLGDLADCFRSTLEAIDYDGAAAAIAACHRMPFWASQLCGFEIRGGEPGMDVLFQLRRSAAGHPQLAATIGGQGPQTELPVARLLERMGARDPERTVLCRDVWVEYDLDGGLPGTHLPPPSLFFGPDPDEEHLLDEDFAAKICEIAEGIVGSKRYVGACATYRLLASIAAGTSVRCVQHGLMLARSGDRIRLCLTADTLDEVTAVLRTAGLLGDLPRIESIFTRLRRYADWWYLDVDVGSSGVPVNVSLELGVFPMDPNSQVTPLLNEIAAGGYAPESWCKSVAGARSEIRVGRGADDPRLAALADITRKLPEGHRSGLLLELNHVKFAETNLLTKAYIAMRLARWRRLGLGDT